MGRPRKENPGNAPQTAQSRAKTRLSREYPDRYRELYEEEMRALGYERGEVLVPRYRWIKS